MLWKSVHCKQVKFYLRNEIDRKNKKETLLNVSRRWVLPAAEFKGKMQLGFRLKVFKA